MKDEIKELLDKLDYIISRTEDDNLVNDYGNEIEDYITNLQEENEELKKNQRYHKKFGNDYIFCLEGDKETYKDYIFELQERIEKAIEYINNNSYFEDNIVKTMIFKDYSSNLLNILQGVGKDE